ncbi:MAG: class I SAM-dependent methyltransferase [Solirubrobacterales bacterium]
MRRPEQITETAAIADLPLPPAEMRFMGEDDERYLRIGDESVAELREVGSLADDDRVLDVGCGYGRLAHALMRDPSFTGTYLGIDILDGPIEWCETELAPHGGGRSAFRHIDVANARYNPRGSTAGHHAELGVEAGAFDLVALISVFTHLDPATTQRYLREVAAALAPGGRCFISLFLLDDTWQECHEAGRSPIPMERELTPFCRYQRAEDPLAAIGYESDWLISEARAAGLEPVSPPRLGGWCGREDGAGHLDLLTLRRAHST